MKQQEAEKLLTETFNKEFNLDKFAFFIKELLKGKISVQIQSKNVHSEFGEYLRSFKKLGDYKTGKQTIEILAVELKRTSSLERARTMQRNFVAKWLNSDLYPKDGALVAFYGETPDDWRFSFVKMDYKLGEDGKVIKELTPAKRLSYLVGKHEPNHTCKKQFLSLLSDQDIPPTLDELEKAFSVENVTKEFFDLYKQRFFELKESLDKVIEKSPKIKKDFELKQINSTEFSKKLLGQIVFLYFLQKKGWLGVKKEEDGSFGEWGTGPKNFMTKLFNKEIVNYNNFFDEILEPLFYEALAKERDGNFFSRFSCKIPFLNGGLFEPIKEYDWVNTKIEIDNEIFRKIIIETFDKFNFTIKEDEPLEREVAVDPEMLGKVFENLLDVSDRKSKGAFYTPREIVHYMCQQSLINYLETNSKVSREDLEKFILKGDLALDYLRRAQLKGRMDFGKDFMLPESIGKNVYDLEELLKNIKICDPAVGSGAFPVGMMNEIVRARQILNFFIEHKGDIPPSDYQLKRETIENSLYGVDIESSAVEITKLRFWLSLIVEENDMQNIKPLPNLDNKIMCGNSLIEEFEGVKLFNDDLLTGEHTKREEKQSDLSKYATRRKESAVKLDKLSSLQKDYFGEDNGTKKKSLMKEIENLEWQFIEATLKEQNNEEALNKLEQYKTSKSKPFFLWKLYFSDVFRRENPGFDVVIGNPPYVSIYNIPEAQRNVFLKEPRIYRSALFKFDLYVLFIELAVNIIRTEGTFSFITSNKWLNQKYGSELRKILLEKTSIEQIINFKKLKVFDTATVDTNILISKKSISKNDKICVFSFDENSSLENLNDKKYFIKIDSQDWRNLTPLIEFRTDINPLKLSIINKIKTDYYELKDIAYINYGARLGGNKYPDKSYFLSDIQKGNFNKKFVEGKNLKRWVFYGNLWLDYKMEGMYNYMFPELFESEKICVPNICNELKFSYDNSGLYNNQTIENVVLYHSLSKSNYSTIKRFFEKNPDAIELSKKFYIKYILALVNSRLINWFFLETMSDQLHCTIDNAKQLPIKNIPEKYQKPFIEIVDKILAITKDEDYLKNPDNRAKVKAYEKQIDKLVYELYGLTPEEIKIVEEFGAK